MCIAYFKILVYKNIAKEATFVGDGRRRLFARLASQNVPPDGQLQEADQIELLGTRNVVLRHVR